MRHSIRELADVAISSIEEPPTQAMTATIAKDVARAYSSFIKVNKKEKQLNKLKNGETTIKTLEEFKFILNRTQDDNQFSHPNSSNIQHQIDEILQKAKSQITNLTATHNEIILNNQKKDLTKLLLNFTLSIIHLVFIECETYIADAFNTTDNISSLNINDYTNLILRLIITNINDDKFLHLLPNINEISSNAHPKTLVKFINTTNDTIRELKDCKIFKLLSKNLINTPLLVDDEVGALAIDDNVFKPVTIHQNKLVQSRDHQVNIIVHHLLQENPQMRH